VSSFAPVAFSSCFELQWPDDFDWEATRAINKPAPKSEKTNEKLDSDSDKKHAEVNEKEASVEGDSYDVIDDDLDPVALNKAFKFAATCSLTLVSFL
jgi:urea-proton symporter